MRKSASQHNLHNQSEKDMRLKFYRGWKKKFFVALILLTPENPATLDLQIEWLHDENLGRTQFILKLTR
ncbi:hypothetical protein A1356_00635 [Methylomonas koyamae]|uniref:Uncharacterized protein n=1 Tax=Methylomonas koyamae TaxID=702114 RepID=A0AA91I5J5_9GAMM|nr:hypothetical protein A1356_00635 [Methylomonas koyamae]